MAATQEALADMKTMEALAAQVVMVVTAAALPAAEVMMAALPAAEAAAVTMAV